MPTFLVQAHRQVIYYGDTLIDAETEEEAREQARALKHSDFDWDESDTEDVVVDHVQLAHEQEGGSS